MTTTLAANRPDARPSAALRRTATALAMLAGVPALAYSDCFFHEEAIVTTWDIRHERFGWMLAWGDLVWVPFVYTIQAHDLVTHVHDVSAMATVAIVALNTVGYVIFRSANLQ